MRRPQRIQSLDNWTLEESVVQAVELRRNGSKFAAIGMQIAAGVPLMCDEPEDYMAFRLGLFGLDKLHNIDRTVAALDNALTQIRN